MLAARTTIAAVAGGPSPIPRVYTHPHVTTRHQTTIMALPPVARQSGLKLIVQTPSLLVVGFEVQCHHALPSTALLLSQPHSSSELPCKHNHKHTTAHEAKVRKASVRWKVLMWKPHPAVHRRGRELVRSFSKTSLRHSRTCSTASASASSTVMFLRAPDTPTSVMKWIHPIL